MRLIILAVTLLALASPSAAQVIYGSLVGNVRDASDASVPGATVRITETGTGLGRETEYRSQETGDRINPSCLGFCILTPDS